MDFTKPKHRLQSIARPLLKGWEERLRALFSVLKETPGYVAEGFREAKLGVRSGDRPTRRMSILFYLSLLGVGVTAFGFGRYFLDQKARAAAARIVAERRAAEERAKEDEARRLREPPPYQSMGTFSLELREVDGVTRPSGFHEAEMEIVVSCSELDACEWIKANLDRSRGELGPLFTPTDRDKILSVGGKKAFREEIRDSLNRLLEEKKVKGSVIEVLFPRFILS